MEPQSKVFPGIRYIHNYGADGSYSMIVQTNVTNGSFTLGGIASNDNGDYSTPNAHRYVLTRRENWKGISVTKNPFSRASTVYEGIQSKAINIVLTNAFTVNAAAYNSAVHKIGEAVRTTLDISVDMVQWRQVSSMLNLKARAINGLEGALSSADNRISRLNAQARRRARYRFNRGKPSRNIQMDGQDTAWYRKQARMLAKELAQKRLEYVYGVKPLMSSIHGLGEEFLRPPGEKGWRRLDADAYMREDKTVYRSDGETQLIKTTYKVRMIVYVNPHPKVTLDLASRISTLNPVGLLWEATPYSFVVDWFVDVGGFLRSVETAFLHGGTFKSGMVSYGMKSSGRMKQLVNTPTRFVAAAAYQEVKSFSRSSLYQWPYPKIPPFSIDLSSGQLLNAAALLTVKAKRIDSFIAKMQVY